MEKRKWLWKRKSSERSPGESDSSGSFSSYSERYSDEQDALRESPNYGTLSLEVTSKSAIIDDGVKESMKSLTEKLSAALVNVSAKEDLVKQHAKVAEEAVAGWEKAENEVAALKQQLEVAVQQNLNLEVRVSHLEGALKECVRQLRQARDEQEQRISDAMVEKNGEWESTKAGLDKQILELQAQVKAARAENSASVDPNSLLILEAMEKENSSLKQELISRCKDLKILEIERDLSTQAAETASKQQLESIKKVAKLEAECRRLQAAARKSSPVNDHKSIAASSFYAESVTDSHSDGGERLNISDIDDTRNHIRNMEKNGYEPSCSDSWASLLISELDNFKNEKSTSKSLATCTVEIDMMDDFLEMERLAALPDTKVTTPSAASEAAARESVSSNNPLKAEVETLIQRVAELENKLEKIEAEKLELERALNESQFSLNESKGKLADSQIRLEELQKELTVVNDAKELLEFQLVGMEAEARTMSSYVDSLKTEIEKERTLSSELKVKCQELENELAHTTELQHTTTSNGELKLKKEDLAVAADKLAECQKTIASLGRQLQSLATLEDFLIDTSNISGISTKSLLSGNGEFWRLHSNDMSTLKCDLNPSRTSIDNSNNLENGKNVESTLSSSSSTSSANHITSVKSRNGFGKFFSRSKCVIEIDNRQD